MERFILRFTGAGDPPAEDVRKIRGLPGLRIVDTSHRMLLVASPEPPLEKLLLRLSGWALSKEHLVKRPDPRPQIKER